MKKGNPDFTLDFNTQSSITKNYSDIEIKQENQAHFFESLMRHDSYRRVNGKIRQQRWGK